MFVIWLVELQTWWNLLFFEVDACYGMVSRERHCWHKAVGGNALDLPLSKAPQNLGILSLNHFDLSPQYVVTSLTPALMLGDLQHSGECRGEPLSKHGMRLFHTLCVSHRHIRPDEELPGIYLAETFPPTLICLYHGQRDRRSVAFE